jgi:hypothetical protein
MGKSGTQLIIVKHQLTLSASTRAFDANDNQRILIKRFVSRCRNHAIAPLVRPHYNTKERFHRQGTETSAA